LRALLAALLLSATTVPAAGQTDVWTDEWHSILPNDSALVIAIETPEEGARIKLVSAGTVLDDVEWAGSLPFVRQYRLPAGNYRIITQDASKPVEITAEIGRYSYLKLGWDTKLEKLFSASIDAAIEPDAFWETWKSGKFHALAEWTAMSAGSAISPATAWSIEYIRPTSSDITISLEVPDRRPPPQP
jgi:hypothetical protein